MLIKIFKNKGKGSAKASIDYLLGKDRNRELAIVLKGNPELSLELAQSSAFSNKYTVGCLSFEETDLPKESKSELMDKFEEMVFAGLDNEQFNISWIEHRDKGRLELNFFIPNVELTTGKRYQPYFHRNDRNLFDCWIQLQNYHYQLSDPHDPTKKQLCKFEFSADMQHSKIKENLTALICDGIARQLISSRTDIIELLEKSDFSIERTTEKSISIGHPNLKKNIRLSGAIYENQEFDGKFAEAFKCKTAIYQSGIGERISQAQATFEQLLQRRTKFNQQKYRKTKSLVNTPNSYHRSILPNTTEHSHYYALLSTPSNQRSSNELTTTQDNIQPITNQRTCQSEHIREREDYPIENPTSTRQDFPRAKWQLNFRDLQRLGVEYAQRIQQCIERLFEHVRTEFTYLTDRKRAITDSEQRIEQSKRTIATAQQRISESKLAIKSIIEQKQLKRPITKISM
ncbi:relaxase/mobilization nuclease domain-containing protein [Pasteurella multocida]|uniref:relaxase/mobilization nuclease domain-containing protein n=1 Tax=Pasteurella multocida TaxID=747 RepID=UPI0032F6108D|nr:relaxase/mobilization nuclease domain-containing protein [Pasteurella multocida]HDR1168254.1 relaxase/mobilization nuclease domain-containing protein [Pasteurella multocida]HDR1174521.1 relaxase/mobilization nuclease domain-containing protein [Pasteurella multocida]